MPANFDLIVFDWDGTVMDSTAIIVHSIQAAARDLDLPVPDDSIANYVIGLGLADALRMAVPTMPPEMTPQLVDRYRHHYLARDGEIVLFPGIRELLARLSAEHFWVGVATGKNRAGLDRALVSTGLGAVFDATRCADETFSKPHPQMLNELMETFAVPPERTLMIGDTTHDLQLAANAGSHAVAVSYGAHPRNLLEELKPRAIVNSVPELDQWLKTHA
jgi:phosphoglycolate phosphatase